jgi:cytochrome d ubiquinol oxidase subunit II
VPGIDELPEIVALVGFLALVAYAILAGADFGGGIWDLLAQGPRSAAHRAAIAEAMGPVWEANHVWLIFVIVLLFTAFPPAFQALSIALYLPFHLVLGGIALRGAAFVFRAHGSVAAERLGIWGSVFGAASAFTPLLLGSCLGAISNDRIRVQDGEIIAGAAAWLSPFAVGCGALALALCAYLAAVYLTLETHGELRNDFRRRALATWWVAGLLSIALFPLAYADAPRLWQGLLAPRALPALVSGALLALVSGVAVWQGLYQLGRLAAAAQVALLLGGWALAQWPYLIYPDLTLHNSAAPAATLGFFLATVPPGLALILPSLWYLFAVFKGHNAALPASWAPGGGSTLGSSEPKETEAKTLESQG